MSFECMAWAIKQKGLNPSEKLVLLLLANNTNNRTGQCNATHKSLSQDCETPVSTLKRHLDSLVKKGVLKIHHRFHKNNNMQLSSQYELLTDQKESAENPEEVEQTDWENDDENAQNELGGSPRMSWGVAHPRATTNRVETGIETGREAGTQTSFALSPEVSKNKKQRQKKPLITLAEWIAETKAKNEKILRDDDPLFEDYPEHVIPREWLVLHWNEFKNKFCRDEPDHTQKDWRAHFRKSVRGNWYRIWQKGRVTGELELSAVGVLAQRASEAKVAA